MASVASQLIEEATAHAQSDSLEDAREICADGTDFPNDLRMLGTYLSLTYQHNQAAKELIKWLNDIDKQMIK